MRAIRYRGVCYKECAKSSAYNCSHFQTALNLVFNSYACGTAPRGRLTFKDFFAIVQLSNRFDSKKTNTREKGDHQTETTRRTFRKFLTNVVGQIINR